MTHKLYQCSTVFAPLLEHSNRLGGGTRARAASLVRLTWDSTVHKEKYGGMKIGSRTPGGIRGMSTHLGLITRKTDAGDKELHAARPP